MTGIEPEESKYVRYIQNGVIMTQKDARSFAQWIIQMLNEEGEP